MWIATTPSLLMKARIQGWDLGARANSPFPNALPRIRPTSLVINSAALGLAAGPESPP